MPHRSAKGALRERREAILDRLAALEVTDDAEDERASLVRGDRGTLRAPFRPETPVTTTWVHHFR